MRQYHVRKRCRLVSIGFERTLQLRNGGTGGHRQRRVADGDVGHDLCHGQCVGEGRFKIRSFTCELLKPLQL